jgi:hypothetical protein
MNLTGQNVRPEGKRVLVIRRGKWEDNVKMDLKLKTMINFRLGSSGSGCAPVTVFCEGGNEL